MYTTIHDNYIYKTNCFVYIQLLYIYMYVCIQLFMITMYSKQTVFFKKTKCFTFTNHVTMF